MNSSRHPNFPPPANGPAPLRKRSGSTRFGVAMVCTTVLLLSGVAGFLVISDKDGKNPTHEATAPRSSRENSGTEQSHAKTVRPDGHRQTEVPPAGCASANRSASAVEEAPRSDPLHETTPALALEPLRAVTPEAFGQGWAWPLSLPNTRRTGDLWPVAGGGRFAMQGAGGLATQAEINALVNGFEQELQALQAKLINEVFGDSFPLLGTTLLPLAQQQVPELNYIAALKSALTSALGTLNGSATYTETQVENAVRAALTSAGINFGTAGGVNLDASNATDLKLFLTTGKIFPPLVAELDSGLGIPGLGLQTSGNSSTVFSYTLNFAVGWMLRGFTSTRRTTPPPSPWHSPPACRGWMYRRNSRSCAFA